MKLNRTPNPLDRNARNGENDNWDKIEGAVKEVKNVVDDFIGTVSEEVINELIDNAQLNWKEFVDNYEDLPTNAQSGDTVITREDGKVYRFDGSEWVVIQQIDINAINEIEQRLDSKFTQKYEDITSQLDIMDEELKKSYLYEKVYGSLTKYEKPSEFNMDLPFDVFISKNGRVSHNYDVSKNKKEVTTRYYVDVVNGDNNNDGTKDSPFRDLNRAFRYNPVDEIVLKSGVYGWRSGEGNSSRRWENHSFNIIGEGDVYLGAHRDEQEWVTVSGRSSVYTTNATNVTEIVDITDFESPIFYEQVNSIDQVENTINSYYIDGNDIYVRTDYDGPPNDKLLLNMGNYSALNLREQGKIYCENIKFTNTFTMDNEEFTGELYAKNCDFMIGSSKDALQINGDVYFELQNCRAMYGDQDGFNYHVKNNKLPQGVEIDCYGAFNGRDGANQNNGSTMHDGGKIIRIGGEYHSNQGPNVIDVNPGTQSLNIGVHAHNSTSTSDLVNVDFRTRDADMWLVNCVSHDSKYSTSKEGDANLYVDNSLLLEPDSEL